MKWARRCSVIILFAGWHACGAEAPLANPHLLDDVLRLSDVQAKGTHNSYHIEPADLVHPSHAYTQPTLLEQLVRWGVRQLELDLHYRDGNGIEVFHLPLFDEETHCRRFVDCLQQIKFFSDNTVWHLPLIVWLEPKELDFLDTTLLPLLSHQQEIEEDILKVFPREQLFTPDDLRQKYTDLPSAIAQAGWPTLGALRGRVLFALLHRGAHREAYLAPSAILENRLLFVTMDGADGYADMSHPAAAMFKIDDARMHGDVVRALVEAGFLVTSNVDAADMMPQDNADKLAASLEAGVHFGSTDFPLPPAEGAYWFEMSDGNPARCNPVSAPPDCLPEHLENLIW